MNHVKTHKGDEGKVHLCHQCGKYVVNEILLDLKGILNNLKINFRSFTQKSQLKLHEKRHAGFKPHICPTCNMPFTTRRMKTY